jgi:hypothetical protein
VEFTAEVNDNSFLLAADASAVSWPIHNLIEVFHTAARPV